MKGFGLLIIFLLGSTIASGQIHRIESDSLVLQHIDSLSRKNSAVWVVPGISKEGISFGAGYRHNNSGMSLHISQGGSGKIPESSLQQMPVTGSTTKRFHSVSGTVNLHSFFPLDSSSFAFSGSVGIGFARYYDFTYFSQRELYFYKASGMTYQFNIGTAILYDITELVQVGVGWSVRSGFQGSLGLCF